MGEASFLPEADDLDGKEAEEFCVGETDVNKNEYCLSSEYTINVDADKNKESSEPVHLKRDENEMDLNNILTTTETVDATMVKNGSWIADSFDYLLRNLDTLQHDLDELDEKTFCISGEKSTMVKQDRENSIHVEKSLLKCEYNTLLSCSIRNDPENTNSECCDSKSADLDALQSAKKHPLRRRSLSCDVPRRDENEFVNFLGLRRGSFSVGDLTSAVDNDDCIFVDEFQDNDFVGDVPNYRLAGKSVSVDCLVEKESYNHRRNGLNLDSNSEDDDFLTDLVEFKKQHKIRGKSSSGRRFARSVENLLKLEKQSATGRKRAHTDTKLPSKGFFRKHLFAKQNRRYVTLDQRMPNKERRLSITMVKDSVKKLSGISEMYLDEKGNVIRKIEITKYPGQALGFFIRLGNGINSTSEGVFVSRVTLESFVDVNNLLHAGDEILTINQEVVKGLSLKEVVKIMQTSNTLHFETRSLLPLPMHSHAKLHASRSVLDSIVIEKAVKPQPVSVFRTVSEPFTAHHMVNQSSKQNGENNNNKDSLKGLLQKIPVPHKGRKQIEETGKVAKIMKSPRLFRKNEPEKDSKTANALLIPSTSWFDGCGEPEPCEEDLRVYESDAKDFATRKTFTGNLLVSVRRVACCSDLNTCRIEVDEEYKASTEALSKTEESFDIEVQKAREVTFQLSDGNKNDMADIGRIYLGKLLTFDSRAEILLKTEQNNELKIRLEFTGANSFLKRTPSKRTKGVFGFNISQTLLDEGNTIPMIVRKCVEEIEERGVALCGIYRISGNARKKKFLRARFEEDSSLVDVSDGELFDCHVIGGVLKDYLRELPQPLISQELYLNVFDKTSSSCNEEKDKILMDIMKQVHYTNRATLIYIMEHLQRVAGLQNENKMTIKNLAVCFGPVMMCPPVLSTDMVDFKKQVDALEYLLTIWPKAVEVDKV